MPDGIETHFEQERLAAVPGILSLHRNSWGNSQPELTLNHAVEIMGINSKVMIAGKKMTCDKARRILSSVRY